MSTHVSLSERLRDALMVPNSGVVGMVDQLLQASREQTIRLDWQDGSCRLSVQKAELPIETVVSWTKSVFRAALARIAALCNERNPGSVSPYGGKGEVAPATDPTNVIRVTFSNTSDESWLELAPKESEVLSPLPTEQMAVKSQSPPAEFSGTR